MTTTNDRSIDFDAEGRLAFALGLEMRGELDRAVHAYEEIVEAGDRGPNEALVRKHLGNLHLRMGHLRRAREHVNAACELDPENPAFWHDLGVVHYYLADFDACVECMRRAITIDRDLQLCYFWLGNALYHRGDLDDAASTFGELLERYPNFTIGNFHLGVIHERKGETAKAKEQFRAVLLKNPHAKSAQHYLPEG
jgi:tetratricopeptide (TPR) repeat protein